MRKKKCVICQTEFVPNRPFEKWCSIDHAIDYANQLKQKNLSKQYKEAKEHAKTRQDWIKEVQVLHNRYCRERDQKAGYGCISCGTKKGKANGGHYRSVGSSPELRFERLNCHLQCERCNSYLSGNLINYRINLIKRIGLEAVEWLEGQHEPKKWTIPELKELKAIYKEKLKNLTKNN